MHTLKERTLNWLKIFFNFRTITTFMAIVILIVGGISLEKTSCTVVKTGVSLFAISDEINDYNQSYIKTNERTEHIEELFAHRQQRYYQSDDAVVRTYSNMFVLWKFLLFFVALAAVVVIPLAVLYKVYCQIFLLVRRGKYATKLCRAFNASGNTDGSIIDFQEARVKQAGKKASGMR